MATTSYSTMRPEGKRPAQPEAAKSGIWVAVAAITMSFAAFTSAMIVRQGSGNDWVHIALPSLLYLNTAILLVSSCTLEIGRRSAAARVASTEPGRVRLDSPRRWLYVTLLLGLVFVGGQCIVWRELRGEGLYLATAPSSSFFYILTVLHALHVLGGLAGLVYVIRKIGGAAGRFRMATFDAAAIYWHFMAGLWIYLLLVLRSRL
jgi:cytochrome c oxidase subunit 3